MNTQKEFESMIEGALADLGGELAETKEALAEYAAERAAALAEILESGEPGFEFALTAARDNMALRAGLKIGEDAERADGVWLGLFAGGLRFAAAALL